MTKCFYSKENYSSECFLQEKEQEDFFIKEENKNKNIGYLNTTETFIGKQETTSQSFMFFSVEIKYIDCNEQTLFGYMNVHDVNTIEEIGSKTGIITTFFKGEFLGDKNSFETRRWGVTKKTDVEHWLLFDWFSKDKKRAEEMFEKKDWLQENIFMRWKELYTVPERKTENHRGISFEGFYYMEYNLLKNEIEGYYYHRKTEKYQKLFLKGKNTLFCKSFSFF